MLKDVVEAFEGPILLSECMESKGEDDCPFRLNCPVRSKWDRVQAAMLREMASITFQDLVNEAAGIPIQI
jgi:DNA-binding IscR family transcriptional regulator